MIVAVDDEQIYLDLISETLEAAGYAVKTFTCGLSALEYVENTDAQLIISDINMPQLDGFQFYQAYQQLCSYRNTPFIFLSSYADSATIIKGLNSGADDYLQKPIHPEILTAKVQSILQRRGRYVYQKFSGNLQELPFTKVVQFCELKNLTGWVDVVAPDCSVKIIFQAGELQFDDESDDLEKVFDLQDGLFTVNIQQVDYQDLQLEKNASTGIAEVCDAAQSDSESEKPMGKLSGIKVQKWFFQIQTEVSEYPDCNVATIVVLDGKVVLKRSTKADDDVNDAALVQLIEDQHHAVEEEIHAKLASIVEKKKTTTSATDKSFHQLYDCGYDKYCSGNYSEALQYWEDAEKLIPNDKTLAINLAVVRKKLANK